MSHNEPARIPSGECDGCAHTDCPDCGKEASRTLLAAARTGTHGLIDLALEVCYQTEKYGKDIPGHALTLGTLARLAIQGTSERHPRPIDYAWADGICEALTDTAHVQAKYPTVDESEAYTRGVAIVAWWREDQRRQRDIQAAKDNVDAWTAMGLPSPVTPSEFTPCTLRAKVERLGIAYAAGSQEPLGASCKVQGTRAAPGFESRAQHRGRIGR